MKIVRFIGRLSLKKIDSICFYYQKIPTNHHGLYYSSQLDFKGDFAQ